MGHPEWKRIALRRSYAAGFEIDGPCAALLGRCEIASFRDHLGQQKHLERYGKPSLRFSVYIDVLQLSFGQIGPG